jgi:hypothetical protein
MKTINKLINICYCLGAAVVILGAWAKILHKPGANVILTVGLLTEAGLFVFMGIQEWTSKPEEKSVNRGSVIVDTSELTGAVKETNQILRSVFNTK